MEHAGIQSICDVEYLFADWVTSLEHLHLRREAETPVPKLRNDLENLQIHYLQSTANLLAVSQRCTGHNLPIS